MKVKRGIAFFLAVLMLSGCATASNQEYIPEGMAYTKAVPIAVLEKTSDLPSDEPPVYDYDVQAAQEITFTKDDIAAINNRSKNDTTTPAGNSVVMGIDVTGAHKDIIIVENSPSKFKGNITINGATTEITTTRNGNLPNPIVTLQTLATSAVTTTRNGLATKEPYDTNPIPGRDLEMLDIDPSLWAQGIYSDETSYTLILKGRYHFEIIKYIYTGILYGFTMTDQKDTYLFNSHSPYWATSIRRMDYLGFNDPEDYVTISNNQAQGFIELKDISNFTPELFYSWFYEWAYNPKYAMPFTMVFNCKHRTQSRERIDKAISDYLNIWMDPDYRDIFKDVPDELRPYHDENGNFIGTSNTQ